MVTLRLSYDANPANGREKPHSITISLDQFLTDNEDSPEVCEIARNLELGKPHRFQDPGEWDRIELVSHSQVRFEEWWSEICRKGDPMRRPHLTREAFDAGYLAGLSKRLIDEVNAEAIVAGTRFNICLEHGEYTLQTAVCGTCHQSHLVSRDALVEALKKAEGFLVGLADDDDAEEPVAPLLAEIAELLARAGAM